MSGTVRLDWSFQVATDRQHSAKGNTSANGSGNAAGTPGSSDPNYGSGSSRCGDASVDGGACAAPGLDLLAGEWLLRWPRG